MRPGFLVLPQRQIQAALEQVRLDRVMREPLQVLCCAQPGQGCEILVLVEIEQHFAPVQVFHCLRRADERILNRCGSACVRRQQRCAQRMLR